MKKDYPKINILLFNRTRSVWMYECSTNWSRTCKEAKASFLRKHKYLSVDQVKANFAKGDEPLKNHDEIIIMTSKNDRLRVGKANDRRIKLTDSDEDRALRGGIKQYYNKDKWCKIHREYLNYKTKLFKEGKIKMSDREYYRDQLKKVSGDTERYNKSFQIVCPDGASTEWIELNPDSIAELANFLQAEAMRLRKEGK